MRLLAALLAACLAGPAHAEIVTLRCAYPDRSEPPRLFEFNVRLHRHALGQRHGNFAAWLSGPREIPLFGAATRGGLLLIEPLNFGPPRHIQIDGSTLRSSIDRWDATVVDDKVEYPKGRFVGSCKIAESG